MMTPPITVVIPLYNKERYIRNTIESVLGQTHPAFELVVVDDGSTDASADIVRSISDDRIRLVSKSNGGVSAARNTGIEAASFEHIAFLDADDRWKADHLQKLAQLIVDFPQAGLYCTAYQFIEPSGERRSPGFHGAEKRGYVPRFFHSMAQGDLLVATASSVCIPKTVFRQVGLFPEGEALGEDQDMWARIALSWPVVFEPAITALYCRHDDAARACNTGSYQYELPYSRRLQQRLDNNQVAAEMRSDLQAYIRTGLFTMVSVNVRRGDKSAAKRILRDPRVRHQGLRYFAWYLLASVPADFSQAFFQLLGAVRKKRQRASEQQTCTAT